MAAATISVSGWRIAPFGQWRELTCEVWRLVPIWTALPYATHATNDPLATASLTTDCSSVTVAPPTTRIAAASPAALSLTVVVSLVACRCAVLAVVVGRLIARLAVVGPRSLWSVALVAAGASFGLLGFRVLVAVSRLEVVCSVSVSLMMDGGSVTETFPTTRIAAAPPAVRSSATVVGSVASRCAVLAVAVGRRVARFGTVSARFPWSLAFAALSAGFSLLVSEVLGAALGLGVGCSVSSPGRSAGLGGAVGWSGGAVAVGPDATVLATNVVGTTVATGRAWDITITVVAITILTVTNDRMTEETETPTTFVTTASKMQTTVVLPVSALLVVLPPRLPPM